MELPLSVVMLGRVFNGAGRPIDDVGELYHEYWRDINGKPINPVSRKYPRSCIYTGVSSIDGMMTLIRGQKLPIFTSSGMRHNELAAQMVRQARIDDTTRNLRLSSPQWALERHGGIFPQEF
jgi:V/A-type H+-transporting ATPase subunit B